MADRTGGAHKGFGAYCALSRCPADGGTEQGWLHEISARAQVLPARLQSV